MTTGRAYKLLKTLEFEDWLSLQTARSQVQIRGRLANIESDGHFGDQKWVGDDEVDVWELRWKNGRRVYFAYVSISSLLILLGGNKNGQDKDIKNAKKILKKCYS